MQYFPLELVHPIVAFRLRALADMRKIQRVTVGVLGWRGARVSLKSKLGAYIWVGGAVVMGVISLLWYGLSFFSAEIKTRFFH